MKHSFYLALVFVFSIHFSHSQWSNRYPKVDGFGHHVYLEGYELPILNSGPTYPAPAPSNDKVVFSAKGWLWLLDLNTSVAKRITSSPDMDFNPNWSSDGNKIVFVRDNSLDTKIMILDLNTNEESELVNTEALDLDPIFSKDNKYVYYASAVNGSIDLWSINLETKEQKVLTNDDELERLPISVNSANLFIYLKKKGFSYDSIELLDTDEGTSTPLAEENFMSQASFALSHDGRTLAYTWPRKDNYEVRLLDVIYPESNLLLTESNNLPLSPKFSYDSKWVYFTESNKNERSVLKRISVNGGNTEDVGIKEWDWGIATKKIKIKSTVDGKLDAVRMSITNASGHPLIPESGIVHSEGQNGIVFFYSPGEIEVVAPHGEINITAVHGFATKKTSSKAIVNEQSSSTTINLETIWNANENGWYSGDNHFHINYGGTNNLDPTDIVLSLKSEDIDFGYPLLANLGNRFLGQGDWKWKREESPNIEFGQEVRSHFLGHLGLLGIKDIYWPWVWGPYYDVYGRDDRTNAEPLRFTKEQGGIGGYVHPVSVREPLSDRGSRRIPIELIADCVLGEADYIELGCLWSDEIGTATVWHQILNIGEPLTISAGSDVMNNLYRTMAIGAARVYVKPDGPLTTNSYLNAIKNGKSFVSTGPQLVFKADDKEPGEVINSGKKKFKWNLEVHSPIAYDKVEIFVNGKVVSTQKGNDKAGSKTFKGSEFIPEGGWVTARVSGGDVDWPLMDSYPFAESSPIWFNHVGSTSKADAKEAATNLLKLLSASRERLERGYGDTPIPKLKAHFDKAKQKLERILNE